jgi:hypothetical protein
MPLFMVASAAEAGPSSRVQSWQLVAANLAAGATAGCAVEAGKQHLGNCVTAKWAGCYVEANNTPHIAFDCPLFAAMPAHVSFQ